MAKHRVLSFCAIMTGGLFVLVGVTHFLMPRAQLHLASGVSRAFFESLASRPGAFVIHYWAFVLASLSAIGVIIGLGEMLGRGAGLWLRLSSAWAVIGSAVTAVNFDFFRSHALETAGRFASLDPAAQAAVLAGGIRSIDPTSFIGFGLGGIWFITINVAGSRRALFPKALGVLGVFGGVLFELVFLGTLFHVGLLIDIAAGLGAVIVAPTWFICIGVLFLRRTVAIAE